MNLPLDFSIRRATARDAQEIARLEKTLGGGSSKVGRGVRRTILSEEDYADAARNAEYFFVAESGQGIAGFIIAGSLEIARTVEQDARGIREAEKRAPGSLFVIQATVAKNFQRKGIATKLYNCMLSEASGTRPCAFLTIVLGPAKNGASVAFHEKLGFKKACEFEEGDAGKKRTIGLFEKKLLG